MANLLKQVKDAMVRSIMADIPRKNIREEAEKEFCAAVEARLPRHIKAALADPKSNEMINRQTVRTRCGKIHFNCVGPVRYLYNLDDWEEYAGAEAVNKLRERCEEYRAEEDARRAIKEQLDANFSAVRTVKQFEDRFPELVKYLPARIATPNLPVTNDLVEKLKAAGLKQGDE